VIFVIMLEKQIHGKIARNVRFMLTRVSSLSVRTDRKHTRLTYGTLSDWSVAKMAENKTCPFCGSDSIEVYTHYGDSAGIQYGGYYPECTVCGCRLNYYESREEALKAWNERDNDGRE
jgi:Lar family restriction alleviation protein